MKKILFVLFLFGVVRGFAQSTNDVLNLLIQNKTITSEQADSLRAEAAIKQQELDAAKKTFGLTANRYIQMSGYTQVRYQFLQQAGKIDGFDIRRARLDFQGNLSPYFSYRLQTDLAVSPKLLEVYGEIKLYDYLNLTIGQMKLPFSFENLISDHKMELIDRSQVVDALVARTNDVIGNQNGRDLGIQLNGNFWKYKRRYLFDYKLGVFNGSGINVADKNKNKDIVGRLITHPVLGLDLGSSFYSGVGNFGSPTATNQDRNRFGLELNYEHNRSFVRSEYIEGRDGAIRRKGWYAEYGYFLIPQKWQLVLKYDSYNGNIALTKNVTTAYVLGATYHFNNWSKIQAGFTLNKEAGTEINNNFGVIQYQISF